jgi:D-amino-acid dehydrogenase
MENLAVKPVVVVGGGVIGLSIAFFLNRRGVPVTLLDAGPPEQAASHVNAGWIAPTMAEPVPAPGLISTSLRWMLKSDSPLFIEPRMLPNPDFLKWTLQFWKHCNARDYRSSTESFAAFGASAFDLYDTLREAGVRYEEHRDGLVFAYRSRETMETDYATFETIRPFGYEISPLMSADAIREVEPALSETVQGGFWLPNERSIRPDSLVRGLVDYLREQNVVVHLGKAATAIETAGGKATAVLANGERFPAETVVVAAGAWSSNLLKPLHADVPVAAGKGYSIDLTPQPITRPVTRPLYLHETRVAITPLDGMIRLAGTMEFSGLNHKLRAERIAAIARSAGWAIEGWPKETPTSGPGVRTWTGSRPMTPDGLPVIGWLPGYRNLAIASGHAMAGVALAPATGEAIAETIVTGSPPASIAAFNPARFG